MTTSEPIKLAEEHARKVRPYLARLRERARQGPDTVFLVAVFEAVEAALPVMYEHGDEVRHPTASGVWVVDSLTHHGDRAVVHTVDRETWDVIGLVDLLPPPELIEDPPFDEEPTPIDTGV
jgi:hypothetical protein